MLHCVTHTLITIAVCARRFFPSKAKAIGDRIISEILSSAVYDEEEAKNWSIDISDKVREAVAGRPTSAMYFLPIVCQQFFVSVCIESMGPNSRYKIVVQTTVGQMKDQGIRIASRCLWDPTTDNYASCNFKNVSGERL